MAWKLLELAAVLFTLVNVWLAVKENMWTWPNGIIAVVLTLVLFWHQRIYLNAWLQVVYFILSVHGWYEWLHGGLNKTERRISSASMLTWGLSTPIGIALWVLFFYLDRRFAPEAALPVWDSLTTAFSLVGQWMLNMKIIENWVIWAAVDVIYIFMFVNQHLYYFALEYALFVLLCVKGYIDWRKTAIAALEATS